MVSAPADDDGVAFVGGVVLVAGGSDYENISKRPSPKGRRSEAEIERAEMYPDLLSPHRFASLDQIKISFIASGCTASHAVAVDVGGTPFVWGRNLEGQLGLGDRIQRNQPVAIPHLSAVISASCGRAHTAFVTENGSASATGDNKFGQLGNNSKIVQVDQVVSMLISATVKKVACGADFTLILNREGILYSCGSGSKGALGDGSTHVFNTKNHSIKMEVDPQPLPRPISGLKGVIDMAAGINHAAAITERGAVLSWGCGDYGRLGHGVQVDEVRPRPLEYFVGQRATPPGAFLACGGSSTIITSCNGTYCTAMIVIVAALTMILSGRLVAIIVATTTMVVATLTMIWRFCRHRVSLSLGDARWGKTKASGDAMMTPTICQDLRGWEVRSMSAGKATFGVSAESSCILWGQATHGELAGGQNGKKTSASATKCLPLEGLTTQQVACGNGFTVMLMDDRDQPERVHSFARYEVPDKDPFAVTTLPPQKATASKVTAKKATASKVSTKRKRGQ